MVDKDILRLDHIIEAYHKILFLTKKLGELKQFENNWIEQDAMLRQFEVIGEASNYISENLKQKNPQIEWHLIRGMRNFIIHQYFSIQLDTIWKMAIEGIPKFRNDVYLILMDLRNEH